MSKRAKHVMLVRDFPQSLRDDMEAKGMWRCGVFYPSCPNPVYCATYSKKHKCWRNWCLKHAIEYAPKDGVKLPLPEHN